MAFRPRPGAGARVIVGGLAPLRAPASRVRCAGLRGDHWLAYHARRPDAIGYHNGGTRSLHFATLTWKPANSWSPPKDERRSSARHERQPWTRRSWSITNSAVLRSSASPVPHRLRRPSLAALDRSSAVAQTRAPARADAAEPIRPDVAGR